MQTTWILVADSARARVFERRGKNGELHEIETLTHPEARLHSGDLRTGGKGEEFDIAGQGERQTGPRVTTSEKHKLIFAKEISDRLTKAEHEGQFDALVLIAEPAVLGDLRDKLTAPTAQRIVREIDKNWSKESPQRIDELLRKES
jgi:protein required for attachment to host cells